MIAVGAVLLANDYRVAMEKPLAALHGIDLEAFKVELDDEPAVGRDVLLVQQAVEGCDIDLLAMTAAGIARDAESRVVPAAEQSLPSGRGTNRTVKDLKPVTVDLGVLCKLRHILARCLDREGGMAAKWPARHQNRPVTEIRPAIDEGVIDIGDAA